MIVTKNKNFRAHYNKRHDILELHFLPKDSSFNYEDEEYPGIFVRYSHSTDRITGITILDYKDKKKKNNLNEILSSILNNKKITIKEIENNIK